MPSREITFDPARADAMRQAQRDHEALLNARRQQRPMPKDHSAMLDRIRAARRMGWRPGMQVDLLGHNPANPPEPGPFNP